MTASYIKLSVAALLPVIASGVMYSIIRKTKFGRCSYGFQQTIIGLLYGFLAIVGTEWGIPVNGNGITAMVNCRDAAPVAAGLLFGAPAGIIAGLIGGIERWFAVYWGVGSYTRLACTLGTITAGIIAALLRKYMFEDKKPAWLIALSCGGVIEVLHLLLVFVTNINDATNAIKVVQVCSPPMITANGISVMLSALIVSIVAKVLGGKEVSDNTVLHEVKDKRPIFQIIQNWLLIVLFVCFTVTNALMISIQSNVAYKQAEDVMISTVDEICNDIVEASDAHMLRLTEMVKTGLLAGRTNLADLAITYGFLEVSIVDGNGIIVDSNHKDYVGFDMSSGEQSKEFMQLLGDTPYYVQKYGPIAMDDTVYRKFAGVKYKDGFVQTSYDEKLFLKDVDGQIKNIATNRHINKGGLIIVVDEMGKIVSYTKDAQAFLDQLKSGPMNANQSVEMVDRIRKVKIDGEKYYFYYSSCEGYNIYALYPVAEANEVGSISIYLFCYTLIIIFAVMFVLLYILIKRIVVNQIIEMTKALSSIARGDLNQRVEVRSNQEFASLSDDINATVATLKRYIAEAAARIDKELQFAKAIQESALPRQFPAFPNRKDFDIFATLDTAKEVGGDFYDFYFTDHNQLNFLIADVSGKGIPAAMFMMRAKSVLKSLAQQGLSVNEVFNEGNDALCSENDAEMFVTAWQGQIDLLTGNVKFVNAGHNAPVIKRKNGKFEYFNQKKNLVLAGMEGIPYKIQEFDLEPGDIVFLFTDGVTEATDANNELFGEQRLLKALNAKDYTDVQQLCKEVRVAIDDFVGEADQFDDITMLAFKYLGI